MSYTPQTGVNRMEDIWIENVCVCALNAFPNPIKSQMISYLIPTRLVG